MDDPKLAEKLGLTKNGTFTILDQYAQANLYALLPSEEQLELFPRRDATAQVQMSMLSAMLLMNLQWERGISIWKK